MSDNSIPENDRNKEEPAAADRVESQEEHQDMSQVEEQQSSTNISNEKESEAAGTVSSQTNNQPTKDIITKTSNSPAVYQLPTKKEHFGNSTRIILGDKHENQANKTILLVGETGAGKSTLVNVLLNYAMGTKFEGEVWYQIVEEEKEGQTSDVIIYQMFGYEDQSLPFSLTIIDTPGYGSDRGIKQDEFISHRLLDLFRSEDVVHEIDAVGLVMKATDNRMSDRLMYVFDSVMSLFGNDLEKNIVALMTHSDGRKPEKALQALEVANIKSSKNEFSYFLLNNLQHEDGTEDREILQRFYQTSLKGFRGFMAFLHKTKPQPLVTTMEVLDKRIRLKACIKNLKEKMDLTEPKQTEIPKTNEAYDKHEEEMKNDKFTMEVGQRYKDPIREEEVEVVFYETTLSCTVCKQICVSARTMIWKPGHCEVMKDGQCTVCIRGCPALYHIKENWRYETNKVQMIVEDGKKNYNKNRAESKNKLSFLGNPENQIKLTAEQLSLLDQAYCLIIRLEQIALRVNAVSTLVHLDFLMEKMKEKGDQEKVRKLEEMKRKVNDGTNAALKYARALEKDAAHI